MQHGRCSVYRHSVAVARTGLDMAERLGIRIDAESLVRGALLHDYFLYDWHTGYPGPPCTHGFTHPFLDIGSFPVYHNESSGKVQDEKPTFVRKTDIFILNHGGSP